MITDSFIDGLMHFQWSFINVIKDMDLGCMNENKEQIPNWSY